jgi:hypothetical protein
MFFKQVGKRFPSSEIHGRIYLFQKIGTSSTQVVDMYLEFCVHGISPFAATFFHDKSSQTWRRPPRQSEEPDRLLHTYRTE